MSVKNISTSTLSQLQTIVRESQSQRNNPTSFGLPGQKTYTYTYTLTSEQRIAFETILKTILKKLKDQPTLIDQMSGDDSWKLKVTVTVQDHKTFQKAFLRLIQKALKKSSKSTEPQTDRASHSPEQSPTKPELQDRVLARLHTRDVTVLDLNALAQALSEEQKENSLSE